MNPSPARAGPSEAPFANQQDADKAGEDKEVNIDSDAVHTTSDGDPDSDDISVNAQAGVQDIEALTKVWTRSHLLLAYVM